ncbi:MAG: hypothetical protein IT428_00380 [Planctomycetaceae bacterium]|nr:hypothetical protein [Planctomycetaceae bacterium]
MDISQLHAATGISRRKLRYVLDHRLVPGLDIEIVPDEVGRPRKFAVDVGLAIVSAATLLELGLSHEMIRSAICHDILEFSARVLAISDSDFNWSPIGIVLQAMLTMIEA